ncbi:hypothetical protein NP493_73g05063 [Ridgeia piscesae]|uniref:Uncharacterized protein n=1 Tax=Ridgeia piscesae TaxID=27915 RepID=A0AAD9UIF0_RIDPI|nr:hypothetical protein NP493_73g05063 [Ridgeia piscesae]
MGSSRHLGASWRTWTLRMTSLSSHKAINRCRGKTELLNTVSTQLGLNINRSKPKIMKTNTKNNNPITLKGEPLEETDSFTYLGSTIITNEAQKMSKQGYRTQELHSSC